MQLKRVGLEGLPGGGAEIFAPRTRKKICSDKISADQWLEIHRLAHGLGLRTNATMLYGHIESDEDRVDHVLQLRELQDETHGFYSFIPLCPLYFFSVFFFTSLSILSFLSFLFLPPFYRLNVLSSSFHDAFSRNGTAINEEDVCCRLCGLQCWLFQRRAWSPTLSTVPKRSGACFCVFPLFLLTTTFQELGPCFLQPSSALPAKVGHT